MDKALRFSAECSGDVLSIFSVGHDDQRRIRCERTQHFKLLQILLRCDRLAADTEDQHPKVRVCLKCFARLSGGE